MRSSLSSSIAPGSGMKASYSVLPSFSASTRVSSMRQGVTQTSNWSRMASSRAVLSSGSLGTTARSLGSAGSTSVSRVLGSHPALWSKGAFQAPGSQVQMLRSALGAFGETTARHWYQSLGYKVIAPKVQGNHGFDLIAVKRDAFGAISDVKLIEAKAGTSNLSQLQRQPHYVADKLRQLRRTPEFNKIAREVGSFRSQQKLKPHELMEVIKVDPAKNEIQVSGLSRGNKRLLTDSNVTKHRFDDFLTKQAASANPEHAEFAAQHRAELDKVAAYNEKKQLRQLRRAKALNTAGKVIIAIGVAYTAYQYGDIYFRYDGGLISRRTAINEASGLTGAIAGGFVGAKVGAWAGASVGSIVPGLGTAAGGFAGGLVGGIVGGALGYFGAHTTSNLAMDWYFSELDANNRKLADLHLYKKFGVSS